MNRIYFILLFIGLLFPTELIVKPYLQNATPNSMHILWETDSNLLSIVEWGLNLDKKTIPVNTENFQTNKEGIFAIGDICTYPGKLKLILSGFHEGALAARACFKLARPNEKYRFEFTTTSKNIQEKLGIKKSD